MPLPLPSLADSTSHGLPTSKTPPALPLVKGATPPAGPLQAPADSVAPALSVRPSHSLIRRPSVPLPLSYLAESASPGINIGETRTAIRPGTGVAPFAGLPSEFPTAKPFGKTAQPPFSTSGVAASTTIPSPLLRIPSGFLNPGPLPSAGTTLPSAQPGTTPGSASAPRKLTQRPEVRAILFPPPPPPPPLPPTIGLSPTSFSFAAFQGGANPAPQTLNITNTGGGTLSWSVSDNALWLTLSPISGTAPSTVTVSVDTTGLVAGTYNATITVTAQGATNSPQMVPVTLTVTTPTGSPSITVTSPAANATLPAGPATISFNVQNFTLGDQGMTHLHFYVDSDPNIYEFFNGRNEVLYPGPGPIPPPAHTHFVHWQTPTSIEIHGMATGSHQVRFVLANSTHAELTNAEATSTLPFSVSAPPVGEFELEQVLTGLDFPVAMAVAPDGRIFYNELATGDIRLIDPAWQLRQQVFAHLQVATVGEQGLLGIALDPNFANNRFVYVYHTANNPLRNRVVRLTEVNGQGMAETVILDNLPASVNHNGGNIHFGPDGKLYVTVGDAEQPNLAQQLSYLGGKILRINPVPPDPLDPLRQIPNDNPFAGSRVYALGLRNSFDFLFHPHTGDLWATENGPEENDEVNRIVPGGNYGWPIVGGIVNNPLFVDPLVAFTPTIAPTGIITVGANSAYPLQYHDNLLFADFNNGQIRRLVLTGAALTQLGTLSVAYNGGQGFLLDLIQGQDGFIYVSSGNSIFRVVLSSEP
ncbi:MAG: PQQ-dependent sugar dehydrogenase [Nitrospiraceae bacterium]